MLPVGVNVSCTIIAFVILLLGYAQFSVTPLAMLSLLLIFDKNFQTVGVNTWRSSFFAYRIFFHRISFSVESPTFC